MYLRTRGSFSKYLPILTFFSEQQTLKSITHLLFFPPPSCCLQDFFSWLNTLHGVTNRVAESTVDAAISRCTRSTWTLGHGQTHNSAPAGKGKVIGLDSKCQPMGQIICVMMRNQLAVWGGVCGCVCVCHTWATVHQCPGCIELISVWLLVCILCWAFGLLQPCQCSP